MNLRALMVFFLVARVSLAVDILPIHNTSLADAKVLIENNLPKSQQTHELVMIPDTKTMPHFSNENSRTGLHGLANSKMYPGKVWITLEMDNLLVLIDPKAYSVHVPPSILQVISVPKPGNGPHYVGEYGNYLWSSLKTSFDVLKINHRDLSHYSIYHGLPHPIFVAQHPINNMFYTGEDDSSYIMKIDPATDTITQFEIPSDIGQTPVGMISGPKGIWFTLLGNKTSGTGTIDRIAADDQITYFKLKSPLAANASLLHLQFDVCSVENNVLWLLSSSIQYNDASDLVIKVTFDSQWSTIVAEDVTAIPTQRCRAHRLLPTKGNVFATELTASKLLTIF